MEVSAKRLTNAGTCRITISGEITVENCSELRERLASEFKRAKGLEIDCQNVTAVDVAGIQVLCAAHKTAEKKGKSIMVRGLSNYMDEFVTSSGFCHTKGCTKEHSDCFWTTEVKDL